MDQITVYVNGKMFSVMGWDYTDVRSCIMDIQDRTGFTLREAFQYLRALPVVKIDRCM